MLCAELISREGELAAVRRRLAGLADGGGGVLAVVAPAGMGKTRLVRAAVEDLDAVVLVGRAVPAENPAPYRPLAEAFLGALRGRPLPVDPELTGFEGHLARIVPGWGVAASVDESPVLIGEALGRLAGVLAGDRSCVLVLDDVHWADPETLAVIEYLADALRGTRVLCLCTARPDHPVGDLLQRLDRAEPGVVEVPPLGEDGVGRMVGCCLGGADVPAGLGDFVTAHCDGNPFLVEELLAGLVAAGALRERGERWETDGPLTPSVPAGLRDSIGRRLRALDPQTRRVLGAASLLGRRFEWELLPGIAEVDGPAAAAALRAGVDAQLIDVDGDEFLFRHALTREAVLADLLPPDRRALAIRAWPAVERAHPGLPGPLCQLVADLAEAAGDRTAAAERLVEAARRAFAAGALATAEATARRASQLVDADAEVALDADELQVELLAAAGKSDDALALGRELAARLADVDAPTARRVDLLVAMVRAALAAGDLDAAGAALDEARAVAGPSPEHALLCRIDGVAAATALDRADLADAEALARRSIEGARATHQPDVECETLLVLGRVVRSHDAEQGTECFQRATELAEATGLARWHLRAQLELGLDEFMTEGAAPLQETRALAVRYGDHSTVAVMDLVLADFALGNFDHAGCLQASTACVEAGTRYHLATEPVAQLWLAGAHALGGDEEAMQAAIDASLARDPDDPRILGDLYGRVLTTRAFVRDELDELPDLLARMMPEVRRAPPTTSVFPGRILWALVAAIDGDDGGADARAELSDAVEHRLPFFRWHREVVEAVAQGRAGDRDAAAARLDTAYDALLTAPIAHGMVHSTALLVARAAIRDGWGDPAAWLRRSEAWFAERQFDRLVRRARTLLGEAGAPIPRRGRGTAEVPASLRALGVTSREMDVLQLVIEGRTNKQIAETLYLSPKTVERHLGSLFDRTGVRNRHALAEVGTAHLPD